MSQTWFWAFVPEWQNSWMIGVATTEKKNVRRIRFLGEHWEFGIGQVKLGMPIRYAGG